VAHLSDDTTYIYHVSSEHFDLEAGDLRYEGQRVIEKSIRDLNKCKAENACLCDVFIIGGVNNKLYGRFNQAFHSIQNDTSMFTPLSSQVTYDDLNHFIKSIKYINLMMNFKDISIYADDEDDASFEIRRSSQVISDMTIISDKKAQPPLFCVAQYFGVEDELHGGHRELKPLIIYLFDFHYMSWHLIDRHLADHAYSVHVKNVIKTFKDDLFANIADNVIDNILKRIEH
jgi:hypothetical protein